MTEMMRVLQAWMASWADGERGATMVEYGFLIALIAVAVVASAAALGNGLGPLYDSATSAL